MVPFILRRHPNPQRAALSRQPALHMAAKPVYHALKRLRQFEDRPMHDIRAIRENPAAFDAAMARRGVEHASAPVLALDEARRSKILAAETAQADQNRASKEVGAAKAGGDAGRGQGSRRAIDRDADGDAQPAA